MRTSTFSLALVTVLSFGFADDAHAAKSAAPSTEEGAKPLEEASPEASVDDEGGFMSYVYAVNEWYPIILDPALEPEVEEKVVTLWITTILCGAMLGPLWIPWLIVGEYPGDEYFMREALIAIAMEIVTYVIGGATTSVGIGSILITANLCYLAPVSLINTYDRALKRERAKGVARAVEMESDESEGEKKGDSEKKDDGKAKKSKEKNAPLKDPEDKARDAQHRQKSFAPVVAMTY